MIGDFVQIPRCARNDNRLPEDEEWDLMSFKILYLLLVLLRGFERTKRTKISTFVGLRISFPRIQAIFTRFKLSYHILHFTCKYNYDAYRLTTFKVFE